MNGKIRKIVYILLIFVLGTVACFIITYNMKNNKKNFNDSGFILVGNSSINFKKGTNYKKLVDDKISFKIGDNKYTVPTDSFIHYKNNNISYLKNGYLLDIVNYSAGNIPYYPISSNDIIKYENNKYIINNNIKFNNFVGKIGDDKYIVIGNDVSLAYLNNEGEILSSQTNKFYELSFLDGNIVNINSADFHYQTISSSVYILIGNNIMIDLDSKKICKYDSNIKDCGFSIIDDVKSNNTNTYDDNKNNTNGNETKDNIKTDNDFIQKNLDQIDLNLVSSSTGFDYLKAIFNFNDQNNILDQIINVKLIDVNSQKVIHERKIDKNDLNELEISSLTSNTKYLLSISGTKNDKNFDIYQKEFTTSPFGFNVKKDTITKDSITYSIDYDESLNFESVDLSLENDDILNYSSELCNDKECIIVDNKLNLNLLKIYPILKLSKLTPDTSYSLVFDNYKNDHLIISNSYKKILTLKTLKNGPTLNDEASLIYGDGTLKWNMKKPFVDQNDSIKSILYEIYDNNHNLVEKHTKKTFNKISLKNVLSNQQYLCEVSITFNDNEKDITLPFYNYNFNTVVIVNNKVSFTTIKSSYESVVGTVSIENDDYRNYTYGVLNGNNVKFEINSQTNQFTFTNLLPGTNYTVNVYKDSENIGSFNIESKKIPEMDLIWYSNPNYKPRAISISGNSNDYNELYSYISEIYINLYKSGSNTILKGSKSLSINKDLELNYNGDSLGTILQFDNTSDDILQKLEPGSYLLNVDVYDIHGKKMEISNNSVPIFKNIDNSFSVQPIKKENLFAGYKVMYGQSPVDGIIKINDQSGNKEKELDTFGKIDLEFGDEFIRGGIYKFKYIGSSAEEILSDTYYPEKISPIISLYHKYSDANSITYNCIVEDPDKSLDKIYYQFDDGKIYDTFCNELNELQVIKNDKDQKNFKIYYKADISPLYNDLKKEIILEDSFDSISIPFNFEAMADPGYNGIDITIKNTTDYKRTAFYKVNLGSYESDKIYKSSCNYETTSDICFTIPYEDLKNLKLNDIDFIKVSAYYDSGMIADNLELAIYQNIKTNYYYNKKNQKDYKNALGNAILNVGSYEKPDVNKYKPKKLESKQITVKYNHTSKKLSAVSFKAISKVFGFYFNVLNANVDSFNIYLIDKSSNRCFLDNNNVLKCVKTTDCSSINACSSELTASTKCQVGKDNKYTCDSISNLKKLTTYYAFASLDVYDSKTGSASILANYNSNMKEPSYSFETIKTLNNNQLISNISVNYDSSLKSNEVVRDLEIKLDVIDNNIDPEYLKFELCSNNFYNSKKYCITNMNKSANNIYPISDAKIDYDDKNHKIIIKSLLSLKEFVYGTNYKLKLITKEDDMEYELYNSNIDISPLKSPSFTLSTNKVDDKLYLNLIKSDIDLTLVSDYTITLSECADNGDSRCSKVVATKKTYNDFDTYIFNNILDNTRYKVSINYNTNKDNDQSTPNETKIEGNKSGVEEFYIFTKEDSQNIIDIGAINLEVVNSFKGSNQRSVVGTYKGSNNIEKINKIIYTFTNKQSNNTISFTDNNPMFYKNEKCIDGKCEIENYNTVLNIADMDFKSGSYLVEVSYRINSTDGADSKEVDRLSTQVEYDNIVNINKIEDLLTLAELVNNGDNRKFYEYKLNNDLDFNSNDSYYDANKISIIDYNGDGKLDSIKTELTTKQGFPSIGYAKLADGTSISTIRSFNGVFDGNNHTISNLYISRRWINYADNLWHDDGIAYDQTIGLFGALDGAIIKSLNIKESKVESFKYASVLVGYADETKFENVDISGTCKALSAQFSGILVARGKNVIINNVKTSGTVSGVHYYTGGIAGYLESNRKSSIKSSESSASVKCGTYNCGGIAGIINHVVMDKVSYSGDIEVNANRKDRRILNVGGIVGNVLNTSEKITNVSSKGSLNCSNASMCGGIVGRLVNTSLQRSFSTMNININNVKIDNEKDETKNLFGIGGLVGYSSLNSKILSSYTTGDINISGYKNNDFINGVGTLIGITDNTNVNKIDTVHVNKCYSIGNINGYLKNTYGTGLIGINTTSIYSIFNGGNINEVGTLNNDSKPSLNGYIYGGDSTVLFDSIYDQEVTIPAVINNTNDNSKDTKVYSINQNNNMINKFGTRIDLKNIQKNTDETGKCINGNDNNGKCLSWFAYLFDNDSNFSYSDEYYPTITYTGYNNKKITSPKIKIG